MSARPIADRLRPSARLAPALALALAAFAAALPAPSAGGSPPPVLHLTPGASAAGGADRMAAEAGPGWTPHVSDDANRVSLGGPGPGKPWTIALDVRRPAADRAAWRVSASYRNQLLQRLAPSTFYSLRFRARASSTRPVHLDLARHHEPYRNLGLLREIVVDRVWRDYEVVFRTADSIPPLAEPASSGVWLTVAAGSAAGTVRIAEISLAPAEPLRFGGTPREIATFTPGECWNGATAEAGGDGLALEAPPDGAAFASRELPMDLSGPAWDLVLEVEADAPANVGRLVVLVRSGGDGDRTYAFWSFSGLPPGRSRVVIPRERFATYAWHGPFSWSGARTLAFKLEANGNGPARLRLRGVAIEPRPANRALPPVISHVTVRRVGATGAEVSWRTDRPATGEVHYGATTAYGRTRASAGAGTEHVARLEGLPPGRVHHARVRAVAPGAPAAHSGDVVFETAPPRPWVTGAGAAFPLGLFAVTTIEDLRDARETDFDTFLSYRFQSCSDTDAEARAYLDSAATAGGRAAIGFCVRAVAAGDTATLLGRVRALRDHPALRGWYLYDEPEGDGVDPDALLRAYRAVRRADPDHPVLVASYALGPGYPYLGAFDVALVDRYPVPFAPVDSLLPLLRSARESRAPFELVFQAYAPEYQRWPGSPPGPGRYPTADEMRAMAWLGAVHGARGLWAYAYSYLHDSPGSEWQWNRLLGVARELREFAPVLAAPEAAGVTARASGGAVHASVRRGGGRTWLVAVNSRPAAARATLTLAGGGFRAARDVRSGRSRAIRGGRFADTWPPFGVRVYSLEP